MKLETVRETYYEASGTTSELVRKLGLAGIAIVWVFKREVDGSYFVPDGLFGPAAFFVLTLTLDLFQYVSKTVAWGSYHRWKEKRVDEDEEFLAPCRINWPVNTFFTLKVLSVLIGYVWLMKWFST